MLTKNNKEIDGIKAFNPGRKVSGALKTSAGELDELLQSQTGSIEKRAGWSVWSIPLGAQRVMDAVKESHKSSLSSGRMVALAAGLSVGATVGYMVYRHISSTNNTQEPSPEVSKMTLPVEVYRNISRYQAKFLDMVTQKSGAHVRVLSDSGEPACKTAVCFLLQGSKEQILLARCVLENLVTDCEPVTEALEVPQTAFGRIIGRGGESLKLITRTTGAKVACSKEKTHGPGAKGNVTITGTRQEVQQAKELIVEKVREDTMVRTKISQSSALRQKRGHTAAVQRPDSTETEAPVGLNNNSLHSQVEKNRLIHANGTTGEPKDVFDKMEELKLNTDNNKEEDSVSTDSLSEISKFEIPSPDLSFQPDEHLEVYVSAYENPNHFWIQILGVRSLQLDKLTEEMNRFYNSSNPTEQRVETIVVGDIVAAPYKDHGTWNRARVLGVLSSGLVDLYYVDFGDNGELPRDGLCRMRSDFLSLPFQAIECNLAGVRPKEEVWTEGALDEFERLTHCASWRPLQAKLCSYSHSEISSWPSVKLYDNSDGKTVDIGEELIRRDHAVSFQEVANGKTDRDNLGCLQRMLDDVIGASSELSLSCISLSALTNSQLPFPSSASYPGSPLCIRELSSDEMIEKGSAYEGETDHEMSTESFYSCQSSSTEDDSVAWSCISTTSTSAHCDTSQDSSHSEEYGENVWQQGDEEDKGRDSSVLANSTDVIYCGDEEQEQLETTSTRILSTDHPLLCIGSNQIKRTFLSSDPNSTT
ncbi:Tudor and KH domain-containing protein Tudor domain-containing protein 2 [Larimichthys crocea]|uniref:Tudor and KH domain-containing protein Tudor domain-containing protein 2 n=1 Tax=Larimichthys crocea TaxID=215358 RepID=A0A6G0HZW9_LARCR|nr:Tudor and KH domain-containing protein Tudor domain-containing protein 2 [Larimichthys crocea]